MWPWMNNSFPSLSVSPLPSFGIAIGSRLKSLLKQICFEGAFNATTARTEKKFFNNVNDLKAFKFLYNREKLSTCQKANEKILRVSFCERSSLDNQWRGTERNKSSLIKIDVKYSSNSHVNIRRDTLVMPCDMLFSTFHRENVAKREFLRKDSQRNPVNRLEAKQKL